MKVFAPFLVLGEETTTDQHWVDADGVHRPVFAKLIDVGTMPNATTANVPHEVADIDPAGFFDVVFLHAASATEAMSKVQVGLTMKIDDTNLIVTTTTNLSTFENAQALIAYTKIPV